MNKLRVVCASVLISALVVGCAGNESKTMNRSYGEVPGFGDLTLCVIGGAVAGTAAGVAVGEAIGGVMGFLAGLVMGEAVCAIDAQAETAAMTMTDSDGDGVPDDTDACPNTPAGVGVDAAGCPLYTDADSVPDYLDQCPGTPAGAQVDAQGCPLDSDGDGVADYLDKCPGTPPGTIVDSQGCPATGAVSIVTNINFDFDSAAIRSDAQPKLDRVIALLQETPNVTVRVVGYTDSTGPAEYNGELSLQRAESVREYMISRGIAPNRVSAVGRGEADPLVPNNTREGRAVNRRVEFEVVN